jgi:integrase
MQPDYTVQRFRGGFAVVWNDEAGTRHREKLTAPDRPGAEAEARQRWKLGDRSPWTVGRIVNAYIDDREREGIATTKRQRDAWKAMAPFWDRVSPELIDRDMAQDYAARRKVAAATVRYELGMLSVSLRWAIEAKCIDRAPRIWMPPPPDRKIRHLTHEQFERFFAAVRAPHARLYVLLGVFTMARPTALLQLTWDRVDLDRGEINLNPAGRRQTAKRRPTIPLGDDALAELRQAYEARQSDHVIERAGQPVANVKKAFQAASERSGIHATPYTLRHTGAVWAAEAGTPMSELAQFMGHDSSLTTERHYARYSPGHLRRVANAVQRRAS